MIDGQPVRNAVSTSTELARPVSALNACSAYITCASVIMPSLGWRTVVSEEGDGIVMRSVVRVPVLLRRRRRRSGRKIYTLNEGSPRGQIDPLQQYPPPT